MSVEVTGNYTLIYLGDETKPKRLVLLKRAHTKIFAANQYTGLGGMIEAGETPLEGALRELGEETSLTGIALTEFGHAVINDQRQLFIYYGICPRENLPPCNEGTIEWVAINDIFSKDLIATARLILLQWRDRSWKTNLPFTLHVTRSSFQDPKSVTQVAVKDGLLLKI